MNRLEQALGDFLGAGKLTGGFAGVLNKAYENGSITFEEAEAITADDTEEILLLGWKWKLLIPVRSQRCGEWDDRLLVCIPGELFEMPNVSRLLVKNAVETGRWDSSKSISEFFEVIELPASSIE